MFIKHLFGKYQIYSCISTWKYTTGIIILSNRCLDNWLWCPNQTQKLSYICDNPPEWDRKTGEGCVHHWGGPWDDPPSNGPSIRITLWLFNRSPWKITIFKNGKPCISMGHLYHGYVTNNQRVFGNCSFTPIKWCHRGQMAETTWGKMGKWWIWRIDMAKVWDYTGWWFGTWILWLSIYWE